MESSVLNLNRAPRMRLHFNVNEPVELVEMTLAFQGLGYEYQNFLKEQSALSDIKQNIGDVKLYITKIESNCILAEMVAALPLLGALTPVLTDVNTLYDFVKNTASAIEWLIGISKKGSLGAEEIKYSKKRLVSLRDVVRLVGKNKSSNLGFAAIHYEEESGEDKVTLQMTFTDDQCRAAELGAGRALLALDVREKADKEKVLMYFYQTNTDDPKSDGKTGDKAIIQSISSEPLSVYIIPETDQQRIRYVLDDKTHNPLQTGIVVDVNIETDRNGRPRVYRVVKVHDIIYEDGGINL
jgi:hypothetical protein